MVLGYDASKESPKGLILVKKGDARALKFGAVQEFLKELSPIPTDWSLKELILDDFDQALGFDDDAGSGDMRTYPVITGRINCVEVYLQKRLNHVRIVLKDCLDKAMDVESGILAEG